LKDVGNAEFAAFVRERERPLLRFATVLCGDARRAENLVADTLGRAYEQWGPGSARWTSRVRTDGA
jgi:DNA-directed RNA polymerase specialized sigma24 family protein